MDKEIKKNEKILRFIPASLREGLASDLLSNGPRNLASTASRDLLAEAFISDLNKKQNAETPQLKLNLSEEDLAGAMRDLTEQELKEFKRIIIARLSEVTRRLEHFLSEIRETLN